MDMNPPSLRESAQAKTHDLRDYEGRGLAWNSISSRRYE